MSIRQSVCLEVNDRHLNDNLDGNERVDRLRAFAARRDIFNLFTPARRPNSVCFSRVDRVQEGLFQRRRVINSGTACSVRLFSFCQYV